MTWVGERSNSLLFDYNRQVDLEAIQALDLALDKLHEFDWVLLTSVNGVEFFFRRLRERGIDVRRMGKARVAAVGPKTAEALAERGIIADILPAKYQGEGILDAIQGDLNAGEKVLLPGSILHAIICLPD